MLSPKLLFLVLATALLSAVSCIGANIKGSDSLADIVLKAMNQSVNPCDDFYMYACGGWITNTTIPDDKSRYSKSFNGIADNNKKILEQILTSSFLKNNPKLKDSDPLLSSFFQACMDTSAIEAKRVHPFIADTIRYISDFVETQPAWNSVFDFVGYLHSIGIPAFFDASVSIDATTPSRNILNLGQGGISLPDRSFYLDSSPDAQELLTTYRQHIRAMFDLVGIQGDNSQRAADVLKVETALATISLPGDQLRDPFKTTNVYTLDKLKAATPNLVWDTYISGGKIFTLPQVNVIAPSYFSDLSSLFSSQGSTAFTKTQVGNYLRWQVVHGVADYLFAAARNESFNFFGKILMGQAAQSTRTSTCIDSTDESIGMRLSQYFVKQVFSEKAKGIALDMVGAIEKIFQGIIVDSDWMDDQTKTRALQKLSLLSNSIGYPDTWITYTGINITSADYLMNKVNSKNYAWSQSIAGLSKPPDRKAWEMTPATVNAYYEPTLNSMNFPAGILQNPFFSEDFPLPMNYGAAGLVIGHELSHGYDDQGRLYDGNGKLVNWWTDSVNQKFKQRADCLVNQYNGFSPLSGYFVNGQLTLGENIADNAGLKDSFMAFSKIIGDDADKPSVVPGLTNKQLYFVSFGQSWCTVSRPESIKARLLTDVHSPAQFRVIGPLQNFRPFADTFQCKQTDYMNPSQKCSIF